MKYKIPFIKPRFPTSADLADDYNRILGANWFTNFGPFEQNFSKAIASYVGRGYFATTFSSATAGIIGSILSILGHGNGDKYIVMPSFTFSAGADSIVWCGYKPLFVDIEPDGLQMNLEVVEKLFMDKKYEGKIRGILLCNTFGTGIAGIESWERFSEKNGIALIVDSAAGFGSMYSPNRKVGTAGNCEVFSFHATKPFAIGEGGAVVSKDKGLIDELVSIQNFGFENRISKRLGFNGKLQELNAAIGLRQFKDFDNMLVERKKVFSRYRAELNPDKFKFQENAELSSLCFAAVTVRSQTEREASLESLHRAGVDARTYYSPSLHRQDYFKNVEIVGALNITDHVDSTVLSLPIHDDMAKEDVTLIIETLND